MLSNSSYVLACDIGGTHITSAIVHTQRWEIVPSTLTRIHVNSLADAKSIFQTWAQAINSCISTFDGQISQIGIAMPGPFEYEKGISYMKNQNKYDALYELQITSPLKNELLYPTVDIRYIHDAAAFLQGEVFGREVSNADWIFGSTAGTGLGSDVWKKGEKTSDADLRKDHYRESIFEVDLITG